MALPNVGGWHPIQWGLEQNKRRRKGEIFPSLPDCLSWDFGLLMPLDWELYSYLGSQAFWLKLNYIKNFPRFLVYKQQIDPENSERAPCWPPLLSTRTMWPWNHTWHKYICTHIFTQLANIYGIPATLPSTEDAAVNKTEKTAHFSGER